MNQFRAGSSFDSNDIKAATTVSDRPDRVSQVLLERALALLKLDGRISLWLKSFLFETCTSADYIAAEIIERARPSPLRAFDQIPMRSIDLLFQVKLMAPYLAGQEIAFVGDYDSTSILLGLLAKLRRVASPAKMLLLDFDERLLEAARRTASNYGFENLLETRLYNVFDPIPAELIGQFDWFYTNPPYGCRNNGESARLFIARGCELVCAQRGRGCIILPDDELRPWTIAAMLATQKFLCENAWTVDEKVKYAHQYHLDDDQDLASSTIIAKRVSSTDTGRWTMHYANRLVVPDEIPYFYGRSVLSPYPRYIRWNGTYEKW